MANKQKQSSSFIIQIAAAALATAAVVAPATFGAKHYYDQKQYQKAYEEMQQNHQDELRRKDMDIENIQQDHQEEINRLNATHQGELQQRNMDIENIQQDHQEEINRLNVAHQGELQQKDMDIENIQRNQYPASNTRFSELPEQLRNLCASQTEVAQRLSRKARDEFNEVWKYKKGQEETPDCGAPEFKSFDSACYAYKVLALNAAGFPMWRHALVGNSILVNKTEAEEEVRGELGMAPGEPIDFSWINDFYRDLHIK